MEELGYGGATCRHFRLGLPQSQHAELIVRQDVAGIRSHRADARTASRQVPKPVASISSIHYVYRYRSWFSAAFLGDRDERRIDIATRN